MYERRHSAASLVSLLVVTSLFVWACSSSDHEGASVTTSGGAGSNSARGGARSSDGESAAELGTGGTAAVAEPASMNDGGSANEMTPPDLEPSAAGEQGAGSGGAGPQVDRPAASGGTIAANDAGAPGAGSPGAAGDGTGGVEAREPGERGSAAGSVAVGGAPPVSEPECDPADDTSTPDMFLPCDVSTALYVCRNCHANPPVKGVFSSYVTYADIKGNAAQIYGVIKSGTMPWPPYTLSAWQKSTALKWLGKNGSCAIGAAKSCQ